MKRAPWLISLALVSSVASAEWLKVTETDTADVAIYIDSTTIQEREGFRRFWDLQDLKTRAAGGELSRTWLREIDCSGKRYRALAVISFAGQMGTGELVGRWTLEPIWATIAPETVAAEQMRFICNRQISAN
jgi:hypothetical protein